MTGSQVLEESCREKEGKFFQGKGLQFLHKKKLKSEIFNDKESLSTKMYFCVITKNLNWGFLTNNSVTFIRWDETFLRMKNMNIMGVE